MVTFIQGKEKGIKLKLLPREGEGCYLAPLTQNDLTSDKYLKLKKIIGNQYFQDNLPVPQNEDVKIEEIGEEIQEGDEEIVDIDVDPNNINDEEVEVIKALYLEQNYDELDDDFMLKANLDEVLEEYKDDIPDDHLIIPQKDIDAALDEFISEQSEKKNSEKNNIRG